MAGELRTYEVRLPSGYVTHMSLNEVDARRLGVFTEPVEKKRVAVNKARAASNKSSDATDPDQ